MSKLKIGILREGKVPPDRRVPLSPEQCVEVMNKWPHVEIIVQNSPIRKFKNEDYKAQGLEVREDLSDCEILIGVKEVNTEDLIPNKTYLFFSHTYKMQPYNADLLKTILDKKIRLIDYELLKYPNGKRLLGFGRYAGIVGCYNGWRTLGLKLGTYDLKKAEDCEDREEMEGELSKIVFPKDLKVVLTGFGRVGHGAREILDLLPIREVSASEFIELDFNEPVYTHLNTFDYFVREEDGLYDKAEFYRDPEGYTSIFDQYCEKADMYIACHYWAEGSPHFFTTEDIKDDNWRLKVIADISCDIAEPIPTTIRPSKIADPIYGYDRFKDEETDFRDENAIAVMAVDNLPCELPKDASKDFGEELIDKVLPLLIEGDQENILARASETDLFGNLTEKYGYLRDYVDGKIH